MRMESELFCCSTCGHKWLLLGYDVPKSNPVNDFLACMAAEIEELKQQLEAAENAAHSLADQIKGIYEEAKDEIARAKDDGFEAGKAVEGWY